jgi:hypothetical protein
MSTWPVNSDGRAPWGRKDASNAFKAALQAFGVTWERKTKGAEKVPA